MQQLAKSSAVIDRRYSCPLGHVRRRLDVKRSISDDELGSLIVVLADELEAFSGCKSQIEAACPWRGVCAGIVHSDFVFDCVEVGARELLDHVQLLGGGHS